MIWGLCTCLGNVWWEPQDYTDFHKISVLLLCNLVVVYVDIHTISSKYVIAIDVGASPGF